MTFELALSMQKKSHCLWAGFEPASSCVLDRCYMYMYMYVICSNLFCIDLSV